MKLSLVARTVVLPCLLAACALQAQSIEKLLPVGGEVKPPVVTHSVDPKYPYPRGLFHKAKPSDVKVHLFVDEQGLPQNVTIAESVGVKADQSALDAVRQYRFQPATRHGQPVRVEIFIEVYFRVY